MRIVPIALTSAAGLMLSAGAGLAQDGITPDSLVQVSVDGRMVEVPVALASQACGIDEATIMATAFTEAMLDHSETADITVVPEPEETTEDLMSPDEPGETAEAEDAADVTTQSELEEADVADEAATAAAVESDPTGVPDPLTTADKSADSATADEAAETVDGLEVDPGASAEVAYATVCEIDQATADQLGFPSEG